MRYKRAVKLSTLILAVLMILLVIGVFASNLELKNIYDQREKNDIYWNYNKVLEQPYKYLKIDGGNVTNIIFEPGAKASVRVLNSWWNYQKDSSLTAYVKNDTLYIKFKSRPRNLGEKFYMQSNELVRLFGPQLLYVEGNNTRFELQKLKQSNIKINLSGKSRLEIETYIHNFDAIKINQRDSSQVVFEMSPDLKGPASMHFKHVSATVHDNSILDIGHGFADDVKLNVSDSSAVILSGKSLKALPK